MHLRCLTALRKRDNSLWPLPPTKGKGKPIFDIRQGKKTARPTGSMSHIRENGFVPLSKDAGSSVWPGRRKGRRKEGERQNKSANCQMRKNNKWQKELALGCLREKKVFVISPGKRRRFARENPPDRLLAPHYKRKAVIAAIFKKKSEGK